VKRNPIFPCYSHFSPAPRQIQFQQFAQGVIVSNIRRPAIGCCHGGIEGGVGVGPAVAAGVFACAALEAVVITGGVCFGGRRLVQQPAQVDEVFLGRRALFEFRGAPFGDELARGHAHALFVTHSWLFGCSPKRSHNRVRVHKLDISRSGIELRFWNEEDTNDLSVGRTGKSPGGR